MWLIKHFGKPDFCQALGIFHKVLSLSTLILVKELSKSTLTEILKNLLNITK